MDWIKVIVLLSFFFLIVLLRSWVRGFKGIPNVHLEMYSIVWFCLLAGVCLNLSSFHISYESFFVLCIAWLLVYIGFLLPNILLEPVEGSLHAPRRQYDMTVLRIALAVLMLLSVVANILFYRSVFGALGDVEALVAIRTSEGGDITKESGGFLFNVFGRIYSIYLPLVFYLFKHRAVPWYVVVLAVLVALLTAAGSLTRAPVLFVIVLVAVSIIVLKLRVHILVQVLSGLAAVALLYIATVEIMKLQTGEPSVELFLETIGIYFLGSLVSFDHLWAGGYYDLNVYDSPYYSIDFINYTLKKLGVIESYPSLVRNYTYGIETNVYTYLDCFALDAGLPGIVIGCLIYGLLGGLVAYSYRRNNNLVALILYCYICFAFAFSYMNNELIRSTFFIVAGLAYLIHRLALRSNPSTVQGQ